ncbi:11100_t:CDS:2, partial [Funneliformis mosseae]
SFNTSIDNECHAIPKVCSFSGEQKKLCDVIYSNGMYPFINTDENIWYLVKTGVLIIVDSHLQFTAPLISQLFFLQYYRSEDHAETAPSSLYEFIVKIFRNKHDRRNSIELEYKCERFIDFYVNELDWTIELLRNEHILQDLPQDLLQDSTSDANNPQVLIDNVEQESRLLPSTEKYKKRVKCLVKISGQPYGYIIKSDSSTENFIFHLAKYRITRDSDLSQNNEN